VALLALLYQPKGDKLNLDFVERPLGNCEAPNRIQGDRLGSWEKASQVFSAHQPNLPNSLTRGRKEPCGELASEGERPGEQSGPALSPGCARVAPRPESMICKTSKNDSLRWWAAMSLDRSRRCVAARP
jgi:hypothetical protein